MHGKKLPFSASRKIDRRVRWGREYGRKQKRQRKKVVEEAREGEEAREREEGRESKSQPKRGEVSDSLIKDVSKTLIKIEYPCKCSATCNLQVIHFRTTISV